MRARYERARAEALPRSAPLWIGASASFVVSRSGSSETAREQAVCPVPVVAGEKVVASGAAQGDRHFGTGEPGKGKHRYRRRIGERLIVGRAHAFDCIGKPDAHALDVVGDSERFRELRRSGGLVVVAVSVERDRESFRPCPNLNRQGRDQRRVDTAREKDANLDVGDKLAGHRIKQSLIKLFRAHRRIRCRSVEVHRRPNERFSRCRLVTW